MLSRIAESLFWIGRYVERADDTARLLDVHLQIILEDPWASEDLACRSLLTVMDRPTPATGLVGRETVLDLLAYDRFAPTSIAGSLTSARENARRAREILSTDLWESLNATWNGLPGQMRPVRAHDYFTWVRERAAMVNGLVDSVTARDDTWRFLVLGRSIERADMTARLLTTRALAGAAGPGWTTLLRSCGAYESFLRVHRATVSEERAAGYLLLDRQFPRSVVFALNTAEAMLLELDPVLDFSRVDEARREIGLVRSSLEYRPLLDIVDHLPEEMERVQRACSAASDAIRGRYFPADLTTHWIGEAL
ncbi:alpha-E domain-containing protein [Cellulomonas endophytica]|uniref:alpha-E domain-containing protein n=1 Tax=Cellulomonas endophytica TaxID=2494735 RepID=UPI001012454E|nr:alpha-E domain-containing protein [Cellulomonas endophytica]